ncbi:hypothetical protein [Saccharopolyspora thermophila]|uniref:hypothetical protein n=1 Tax=Saccharopolyspora thermophila TaxID=89367 RepID=UPI001E3C499C|nr:hypothetical protein [Saccharopolyspora subtropica]
MRRKRTAARAVVARQWAGLRDRAAHRAFRHRRRAERRSGRAVEQRWRGRRRNAQATGETGGALRGIGRFRLQRTGQLRLAARRARVRRLRQTAEVAGQRGHSAGRLRGRLGAVGHGPGRRRLAALLVLVPVGELLNPLPQGERVRFGRERGEFVAQVEARRTGRGPGAARRGRSPRRHLTAERAAHRRVRAAAATGRALRRVEARGPRRRRRILR